MQTFEMRHWAACSCQYGLPPKRFFNKTAYYINFEFPERLNDTVLTTCGMKKLLGYQNHSTFSGCKLCTFLTRF